MAFQLGSKSGWWRRRALVVGAVNLAGNGIGGEVTSSKADVGGIPRLVVDVATGFVIMGLVA